MEKCPCIKTKNEMLKAKRISPDQSRSRELQRISGVSKRPLHRSPSAGSLKAAGRLSAGSGKAADQVIVIVKS
jgi:hypothetical protein